MALRLRQKEPLSVQSLIESLRQYNPQADVQPIQEAYDFSAKAHAGQKRESGEPFLQHPLQTAQIIVDLKLDVPSIVAGLLHDTIEDTETTYDELVSHFGLEVADIVMDVTDEKKGSVGERKQRQVDHAASTSGKARLVKLADKIADLRKMASSPPTSWDIRRTQEYFDRAAHVVDQIRGTHPALEALFDAAAKVKPNTQLR